MTAKPDLAVFTFHLNPCAMAISSLEGEFLEVNRSYQELLGYDTDEMVGRTANDLGLYDDPNERERIVSVVREHGHYHQFETRLRAKDGSSVWILGSIDLVTYRDRECLLSSFLDISHRKALEGQLVESRELFRRAFELSPSMMSITRVSDLTYISINQSYERGLGYSRDEVIGRTSAELGLMVDQELQKAVDSLRTQGALNDFEAQIRTKSGAVIDVLGSGETLILNGERCILSVFFDVTERKRAQRAWERTHEDLHQKAEGQAALLATIVESSDDAIIGKTLDGTVVSWNRGAEKVFGYAASEIIGQPITKLIPDDRLDEELYILTQIRADNVVSHFETVRRHKSGRLLDVSITVSPIRDRAGFVVGASKIARDITERKRAEEEIRRFSQTLELKVKERTAELQAANEKLEAFAYAASHDLKTPLRVIDTAAKWLEEDLRQHLTPETRDIMDQLRRRVGRMEKLLDDLLAYSKVGRTLSDHDLEIVTGDALMTTILDLLAPPPQFVVKVDPAFETIRVPRMPLQQILYNLINNAVKHHDKAHGVVEVGCGESDGFYEFFVKDDGPGIPQEYHDLIFKMFQRLNPQAQTQGSGIGLALVEKNIRTFGGRLALESAVGQGSTFRVSWPKQQIAAL